MSRAAGERTLLLLRHAKSAWDDASRVDDERPLAPRGIRAAQRLGAHLRGRGLRPDRVLCSTAERARQTALQVFGQLPTPPAVALEAGLYLASAGALLQRLARLDDADRCVMLIAHNPGLEELARWLVGDGSERALRRLAKGFKTAGLAEIRLETGRWADVAPGAGHLLRFTRPKDLR